MSSGPLMMACDKCGDVYSSQYVHDCSPRKLIQRAMARSDEAPAVACVNCAFYRPIDDEVRQEGQCYLMPPVLSPQTENPWVRPNVRWSDLCSQYKYNSDLEVSDV